MSTAYHPQTDGQSERTIQTLEDMLRAVTSGFWWQLGYHLSIDVASPVIMTEVGESPAYWDQEIVQEATGKELFKLGKIENS
ncbi:putative reverse transcriptase domain-containing protein [Tanacetum coccineum]|uniref:Reverse transcriptase domain-containing protein n=1 Tax=Tanacetum coccineum TaxID=301880 RepID=A0ABQ4X780_9ASTR